MMVRLPSGYKGNWRVMIDTGVGERPGRVGNAAHRMLDAMGIAAFAERPRCELRATGETVRKRTVPAARTGGAGETLTVQEVQVARLARDGLSNPEIGVRLFISPRTAAYHLSNVFTKLGIGSRSQLDRVLPAGPDTAGPR